MEDLFRRLLNDTDRDDARQAFVLILIESLAHGQPLPGFADVLMDTVRDGAWQSQIRRKAIQAFVRNQTDEEVALTALEELIADVYAERISDPDDELLAYLLTDLYPARLTVSEILPYLRTPNGASLTASYERFWTDHVPKTSTNAQLAELLDMVARQFDRLKPVFVGPPGRVNLLRPAPLRWLRRALETWQEDIASDHLFHWLAMASDSELRASEEDRESVREWLSDNPGTMKEIIELGVEQCIGSDNFRQRMYAVECCLFGAARPPDFGSWCLDRAMDSDDGDAAAWFMGEVARYLHLRSHDEDLSREAVERKLAGNTHLLNLFEKERAELEAVRARSPFPPIGFFW